jgi:hypothetical protein
VSNIRIGKALADRAGRAALALLLALVMAGQVYARNRANKSITFAMPSCPIAAQTVPPTKTEFRLPRRNPLLEPVSVTGTIQVTDQDSSSVILLQSALAVDHTGLSFSRTVKTLQHATGELTFDKGCTKTDPYGSNNCQWDWGQSITAAYEGALQENISAGKLLVDLQISTTTPTTTTTIPLQFSCSICGEPCTVPIPTGIDHGRWDRVWDWVIFSLRREPRHDGDEYQP